MSEKKKSEELPWAEEIKYYPCLWCGSLDYDFADATPDQDNKFIPTSCDCCGYAMTEDGNRLTFH